MGILERKEKQRAELKGMILEASMQLFVKEGFENVSIRKIAETKKAELGITDRSKMGQFIGAVMKACEGKADGADVKAVVEELLG